MNEASQNESQSSYTSDRFYPSCAVNVLNSTVDASVSDTQETTTL